MESAQTVRGPDAQLPNAVLNFEALEEASREDIEQAMAVLLEAAATRTASTLTGDNATVDAAKRCQTTTPSVALLSAYPHLLAGLAPVSSEAEAIDHIQLLEHHKSAAAAAQAHTTAVLEQLRHNNETLQDIPKDRRGKGLAAEIALARGDAPARGTRHLNLATALTRDLPNTFAALRSGRIHEEHAQKIQTETAWLSSAKDRRTVDARIAHRLGSLGPKQLGHAVRGEAERLDQHAAVKRHAKAVTERRVWTRPAADGMAYLGALLPTPQAIAVRAVLERDAASMVGTGNTADPTDPTGEPRTRDQLMADLMVERLTGQTAAPVTPAKLHLVMTTQSLLGGDDTPAWIPGHGSIPAIIAKQWLANPNTAVSYKRLFTRPEDDQLVAMESHTRDFPDGIRQMILLRDGICRTPYCDAPTREVDHMRPVRDGGPTSWENAQGLCAACNQTKENNGWKHDGDPEQLGITTPTGHRYTSQTPPLLPAEPPPDEDEPPDITMDTCDYSRAKPVVTLRLAA